MFAGIAPPVLVPMTFRLMSSGSTPGTGATAGTANSGGATSGTASSGNTTSGTTTEGGTATTSGATTSRATDSGNTNGSGTTVPYGDCDAGLSEHAKMVADLLATGNTVQEAVDMANRYWLPRRSVIPGGNQPVQAVGMKMAVVGDPFAKMANVYLSGSETLQYGKKNTWYFVFP